jgi:hypothetical protein
MLLLLLLGGAAGRLFQPVGAPSRPVFAKHWQISVPVRPEAPAGSKWKTGPGSAGKTGAVLCGAFAALALYSRGVQNRHDSRISMKARFEDAEDRRLSRGGSGGRFGNIATDPYKDMSDSQRKRAKKVEQYLDNDLEAADPLIGKIIAGSMLVTLFGLLFAVFAYYGVDGLMAATANQRAVRGM